MSHLSVSDAQAIVLRHALPCPAETVALTRSLGRVLASDILANRDLPPWDVSAMDGFALRSADLSAVPAVLRVIDDIRAGDLPTKTIGTGEAARIMTGAPVPPGADAVIRVEDTQTLADGRVQISKAVRAGNDIRPRGESLHQGQRALAAGSEITPGAVGLLATVKASQVAVHARPRVAILATGDELEGLDEPLDPNRIPDANSYSLLAQCQALGIDPVLLGIARDQRDDLAQHLRRGLEFDLLLVSGGSSVGAHDHVRPTLEALGVHMHFWRVDMRPGHPLAFGTRGDACRVFGLPGNPVSGMVCFEQFVLPLLRRMMGHSRLFRRTVEARLEHAVTTRPGRPEFGRVQLTRDAHGGYVASATGTQSSGVLHSMAIADGLLVVPASCAGFAAGEHAVVQLLDGTTYQEQALPPAL